MTNQHIVVWHFYHTMRDCPNLLDSLFLIVSLSERLLLHLTAGMHFSLWPNHNE